MQTVTGVLDAAGLERFKALRRDAVDAVTQRFYTEAGDVYERFGPDGREACRDDIAYHIEFLQSVLEFGVCEPLIAYVHWLASVLASRGIPYEHVALSLDWLNEFFDSHMAAADARVIGAALSTARAALLESPPDASGDSPRTPDAWPESHSFEDHLLAGDHRGALAVMESALAGEGRGLLDTELHVVQPALYRIGRKWQENRVSVAQEHLSTSIASLAMTHGLLLSDPPLPNDHKVLLACVQGNSHAVGLQMVADAFQLDGWEVQLLGADVPTKSLVDQVQNWAPDLLGLSVAFPHQLRVVKDVVGRLARVLGDLRPPVLVGGLAINSFSEVAAMTGADAWSPDAREAVETGRRLIKARGAA